MRYRGYTILQNYGTWGVFKGGDLKARFKTNAEARAWVDANQ
jgi:hypothetical protein